MYRIDTWSGESVVEHFSRSGRVSARLSGRGRAHGRPSRVWSASILSRAVIEGLVTASGCVRRWELDDTAVPSRAFHARPYCWNSGRPQSSSTADLGTSADASQSIIVGYPCIRVPVRGTLGRSSGAYQSRSLHGEVIAKLHLLLCRYVPVSATPPDFLGSPSRGWAR
ncbi:hypothetical protein MMC07_009385 [Pseudocyphellaria aurata]|nr:hypothetical protein [Pseudocyphellaria aurata]